MTDNDKYTEEYMGTLSYEEISQVCWKIFPAINGGSPLRFYFTAVNHYTTDFCIFMNYENENREISVTAEGIYPDGSGRRAKYSIFKGTTGKLTGFIAGGYFSARLINAVIELEDIIQKRIKKEADI